MNKKILFLMPDFNGGGAEGVFIQLANYFSLKYQVHFMVLKSSGPNLNKLNTNIKVIELKKDSSVKSIFKINKYIKQNNIDVAMGTLAMAYAISIASLFGSKKCKYIARVGSIISSNLSNTSLVKRFILSLYQKALNFSDTIITQSISMDEDLDNYINKKTEVIYNPISLNKIISMSEEKSSIKLDNKYFNIISVGRLAYEKDYKTAILSIAKLKKKIKNIRYYILGDGDLREELLKYSNSLDLNVNIIFVGHLENPYSIMKNTNVLLLTSLYEGFSNAILESLALNVPVVATDSPGGNKEIISNGENGFLVKVGDSDDIAQKLMLIKEQKNYNIDVSKFEINFIANEYEKHF
ncbi:glycosyltransferase [Candidatus Pelagibacter sp.]|jgi:glycosyltransferase involved in cell wall biosynthesis|nr:glycosyltransferase [Candidatus Pelagibacter sp.]